MSIEPHQGTRSVLSESKVYLEPHHGAESVLGSHTKEQEVYREPH